MKRVRPSWRFPWILKKARKGDVRAFVAIADRVEGKPTQQIELKGQVDANLDVSDKTRQFRFRSRPRFH